VNARLANGPTKAANRTYLIWHVVISVLLVLLVAGIQVQSLWQGRLDIEERTRLTARDLGNVLAGSIAGAFQNIDLILLATADQVRLHPSSPNAADDPVFLKTLDDLRRRVPGLIGLHVTDASGRVLYGTGGDSSNVSVADRDYFRALRDGPDAGMIVSGPVSGKIIKRWVLVCARRITLADGQFAGIVYGAIQIEGMAERLTGNPLQLGNEDIVSLSDDDMSLVMRYIDKHQDMQFVGQRLSVPTVDAFLRSGANDGFFRAHSPVDHVDRIFYFERIAGQSMNLVVGLATESAMSGWRREALYAGITTLMIALLIAGGSYLIYQGQVRKLRLVAELAESNQNLSDLSMTDGLTGVANRRHFDAVLVREWRRATRNGQPLALAMLDVDFFKKYNDHYGHQGGDECLRAVAQVLKEHVHRAGDCIARYGGEEFAVLGADIDGEDVRRLAEAIRRAFEDLALPHAMSPFGHITVSIGVAAMVPTEQQSFETLVRMADEALYAAKREGRNRVVPAASSPVSLSS
jgi:diguanylate cyclase (GGDEF)-like protein